MSFNFKNVIYLRNIYIFLCLDFEIKEEAIMITAISMNQMNIHK